MMLRLLLCSENTIIDVSTNRISCINILEAMASPQFPILVPLVSILGIFAKEPGDLNTINCEIVVTLNEAELARLPFTVEFQDGDLHRSLVQIQGFVANVPGRLEFAVVRDGDQLGSWPVTVSQIQMQNADV